MLATAAPESKHFLVRQIVNNNNNNNNNKLIIIKTTTYRPKAQ